MCMKRCMKGESPSSQMPEIASNRFSQIIAEHYSLSKISLKTGLRNFFTLETSVAWFTAA